MSGPWEAYQDQSSAPAGPWSTYQAQPQITGAARIPAMVGSYLSKGAAEGLGAIGDLQDLLQRGVNIPADWVARQLGVNPSEKPTENVLNSKSLVGVGKSAGIMDRPDLQPQTRGERFLASSSEGAGGMLPFAMFGGGSLMGNLARGTVQGAAGGAGGEAAAEALPNYPTAARLGGNIVGALMGGGAFNAANRAAGAAIGNPNPTLQAYRDLGITPSLVGDVSGSPTMQMVQAFAAKAPGGAGRMRNISERAVGQWGDALDRTAANFGMSQTLQEAGDALQGGSRDWLRNWRAAQRQAEAAVSAKIPPATAVDIAPVSNVLQATSTTMPGLPAVADIMTEPVFKDLSSALAKDAAHGVAPWSDVRAWRTRVGEQLQESLLSRDGKQESWRRLYGALSDALGNTATRAGAGGEWTNANTISANGHDFVENVVGKFINNRNPARNTIRPEDAATAAMSGARRGGTTLDAIRQEMPTAADELAAYKLRDMGLSNAGQQNATGTQLSPGTFVTDLNKTLSPEAAKALFANDPRVQELARVGDSMKQTQQMLNTSNTGTYNATKDALMALGPSGAIAGGFLSGGLGAALGGVAGAAAPWAVGYGASRLATSPTLAKLLASQAVVPVNSGLQNRAAILPPAIRALLSGGGVQP